MRLLPLLPLLLFLVDMCWCCGHQGGGVTLVSSRGESSKARNTGAISPLRLTPFYDNMETNETLKTYLNTIVVPSALQFWSSSLSVPRSSNNLFFGPNQCSAKWQTSTANNGMCKLANSTVCGNFPVPLAHLMPISVCSSDSDPASCVQEGGVGVPDSDVLLYFSGQADGRCQKNTMSIISGVCTVDKTTKRSSFSPF